MSKSESSQSDKRSNGYVVPVEPKLPVVVAFEKWWAEQKAALEMGDHVKFAAWNGWLSHSQSTPPSAGERTFAICPDHQNAEWNQPELEGTSCILCRLFYLEAQESLLEEWQQRAKRAEDAIKEIERPLDDQMARLNETVVRLNGEVERYREGMENWRAAAGEKDVQLAGMAAAVTAMNVAPSARATITRAAWEPDLRGGPMIDIDLSDGTNLPFLRWTDFADWLMERDRNG